MTGTPVLLNTFQQLWDAHVQLQETIPPKGRTPYDIKGMPERIQFFKDMELALRAEMQEMLDEMSWKPWTSAEFLNEEAVQGEIIDAFHFLLNLAMAAGFTAETFYAAYMRKRQLNMERHRDGNYTGLDKCPGCRRAMDDPAVTCRWTDWTGDVPTRAWCSVGERTVSRARH